MFGLKLRALSAPCSVRRCIVKRAPICALVGSSKGPPGRNRLQRRRTCASFNAPSCPTAPLVAHLAKNAASGLRLQRQTRASRRNAGENTSENASETASAALSNDRGGGRRSAHGRGGRRSGRARGSTRRAMKLNTGRTRRARERTSTHTRALHRRRGASRTIRGAAGAWRAR